MTKGLTISIRRRVISVMFAKRIQEMKYYLFILNLIFTTCLWADQLVSTTGSISWNGNVGDYCSDDDGRGNPTGTVPTFQAGNLARRSIVTPIGSGEYGGIHLIAHINDGNYGNSYSWIMQNDKPGGWIGYDLGVPTIIRSFAFGRSNTTIIPYYDRVLGTYTIQYTTDEDVNAGSNWITIGTVKFAGLAKNELIRRKQFSVNEIQVTGFRIVTPTDGNRGCCIDELELYTDPPTPFCGQIGQIYLPADLNNNCYVDIEDFLILFKSWFDCTDPVNPNCSSWNAFDQSVEWLDAKANEFIRNCMRITNSGIHAFPPQVGSGYEAFWLRDYEYMLEGSIESFTKKELKDACLYFVNGRRSDGAMVDCIKFDGTPIYKPGYGSMGQNPVADGSQFTVGVAWHTYQNLGDPNLVAQIIDDLILGMNVTPRDPHNGLVYIDPVLDWDRCPYGFTDSVRKKGDVLFSSLLYVQASRQLADLLDVVDRKSEAQSWRQIAQNIVISIRQVFWDPSVGLFLAATDNCNQPDIWGSAFSVYIGVADTSQAITIAVYFKDHYGKIIKRGQLRHTPGSVYWDQSSAAQETYQNGAYWGTPVGWFVYTLDLVDHNLADKTVIDMVNDFKQNGVFECINDNGYTNVPRYIDSVALPLDGIHAMIKRRNKATEVTEKHLIYP